MATLTPPYIGSHGAMRKYKIWMRHRYHSCCSHLGELLAHPTFKVKVSLGSLDSHCLYLSQYAHF